MPTPAQITAANAVPPARLSLGRVEPIPHSDSIIRDALGDWAGHFLSWAEVRKVQHDARARGLAAWAGRDDAEPFSVDEARIAQARCLIRARACQLTGRYDLAATVLKRASVYARTRKPMRAAHAEALRTEHMGEVA